MQVVKKNQLKIGRICLMTISQIGFFQVVIHIIYVDQCEPLLETFYYKTNGVNGA